MTAAFEILSLDLEKKRIGLALVEERSAREAEDVREHTETTDAAASEAFGSIAEKLRGALKPREK